MKKILFLILILVFLVPIVLILTNSLWLRHAAAAFATTMTGFPAHIGKFSVDIPDTRVEIEKVIFENPKSFIDKRFVSIPEIMIDFYPGHYIKDRRLYFESIHLNIEEVSVVRNKKGEVNLAMIKAVTQPKEEMKKEEQEIKEAKSPQDLKFFVEELVLTLRRVRYHDESKPEQGEKVIDLKIEQQVYKGISNPRDIARIVVLEITYKAALGNLGIPVDKLKGHLDSTLSYGQDLALKKGAEALEKGATLLQDAAKKLPMDSEQLNQLMGGTTERAKGIFGGAEEFLKSTAGSVSGKTKSSDSQ